MKIKLVKNCPKTWVLGGDGEHVSLVRVVKFVLISNHDMPLTKQLSTKMPRSSWNSAGRRHQTTQPHFEGPRPMPSLHGQGWSPRGTCQRLWGDSEWSKLQLWSCTNNNNNVLKIRNAQRKVGPYYKEEMGTETSLYEEQNPHFVATKGITHE